MKLISLLILALSLIGCARSNEGKKLYAFGDSFTYDRSGYATMLADHYGLRLVNMAKGGSIISGIGQGPTMKTGLYYSTDTVVVMVGYNDSRGFYDNDAYVDTFTAELAPALDLWESRHVHTFIGGCMYTNPTYYVVNSTPAFLAQLEDRMCTLLANKVYQLTVGKRYIHWIDTNSIQLTDATTLSDYQHPNSDGQELIKQKFQAGMDEYLERN